MTAIPLTDAPEPPIPARHAADAASRPGGRGPHPGVRVPRAAGMAPPRAAAQLLPTLFDRLRDDAPTRQDESPGTYTATAAQMRDILQRDLAYLLNTTSADDLIDRDRFPDVARSTLNYGVPALAGSHLSAHRWEEIELIIRRAIAQYEPRLIPETVMVRPLVREGAKDAYNVLLFEIRAMIDLQPYPLEFTVQSSVDLETHRMSVARLHGGSPRNGR